MDTQETLETLSDEELKKIILKDRLPRHIGVIPDGNRRFARKYGLSLLEAYEKGVQKGEEFAQWCRDLGIKYLTFYALSLENLQRRSKEELQILFSLLRKYLIKIAKDERIHRDEVKVRVFGRLELLPDGVVKAARNLESVTNSYDRYHLILLIAYSGRDEIINAVKRVLQENSDANNINEETFRQFLYLSDVPDPDLIIRTSGEMRLSNFLLWYAAYSELYFINVFWPEITFRHLLFAIRNYQMRERRFGK